MRPRLGVLVGAKEPVADLPETARAIEAAVESTLDRPDSRTADLGGSLGTVAFTDAVVAALA